MRRLMTAVLVSAMLAGCGGADEAAPTTEASAAAESDNGGADMPPDMSAGQGAPEPMNAAPAEYPNMSEPVGAAPPSTDRGLPVCPGDPRCKKK